MGDKNEIRKIHMAFAAAQSCLLYFDLMTGTIGSIEGVEEALRIPGVTGFLQCHQVGDSIEGYGTTDNIAMRFLLKCGTVEELRQTIAAVESKIRITNDRGENMLVPPIDPGELE